MGLTDRLPATGKPFLAFVHVDTTGGSKSRTFRALSELPELEEAFSNSIVVTVAPAAHASLHVIGLQKTLPIQAAELTTLIRMNVSGPLTPPTQA